MFIVTLTARDVISSFMQLESGLLLLSKHICFFSKHNHDTYPLAAHLFSHKFQYLQIKYMLLLLLIKYCSMLESCQML